MAAYDPYDTSMAGAIIRQMTEPRPPEWFDWMREFAEFAVAHDESPEGIAEFGPIVNTCREHEQRMREISG